MTGQRKLTEIHAIDAGDHRERQHNHGEDGEDLYYLIDAVRGEGIYGFAKSLSDIPQVFQPLPYLHCMVGDISPVHVQIPPEELPVFPLQAGHDFHLRLDGTPKVDQISPDNGDFPHDLLRVGVENPLLDSLDVLVLLVHYGETVINEVINEHIEEVIGATTHELAFNPFVFLAIRKVLDQGLQCTIADRDQEAMTDKQIHLASFQSPGDLVEDREVHDDEEVVLVLVDLWPLDLAQTVLQIKRVEEGISLAEVFDVLRCWFHDVGPGYAIMGQGFDAHHHLLSTRSC